MVAGASEGIGAAFATCLAEEGMDLVLIARRLQPLQQLADFLENKYKVNVTCISCDLSFIKNSTENNSQAAQLNMLTPLYMVRLYGERMLTKGKGAVVLMTSMAGLQGSGYLSVYAATKAFNRILAESLWYEWKNNGVDVIACCAGATATPGYKNTLPDKTGFFTPRVLEPEEVAHECLKKLGKQPSFITGRANRIASFIMQKILPRKMAINIMGDNTRKMYRL